MSIACNRSKTRPGENQKVVAAPLKVLKTRVSESATTGDVEAGKLLGAGSIGGALGKQIQISTSKM